jgi:hypothetical protein
MRTMGASIMVREPPASSKPKAPRPALVLAAFCSIMATAREIEAAEGLNEALIVSTCGRGERRRFGHVRKTCFGWIACWAGIGSVTREPR